MQTATTPLMSSNARDGGQRRNFATISNVIDGIGWGNFQLRLMILCGICWSCDAAEAMIVSFLVPTLKREWNLASGVDGLIGAVVFTGTFFGSFTFGPFADTYGRRAGFWFVFELPASTRSFTVVLLWQGDCLRDGRVRDGKRHCPEHHRAAVAALLRRSAHESSRSDF